MLVAKTCLVLAALCGLQSSEAVRLIRSPDKMEVNLPDQPDERESGEYQEAMTEEAEYWEAQGEAAEERGEEGHDQLHEDGEKTQENYEREKEHQQSEEQEYHREMNETYQGDRDKAEAHHESNQDHYSQDPPDLEGRGNQTVDTETGDRYEDKGTDIADKEQENAENYDWEGNTPSVVYTRN